jgi:hypothetical protein
MMIDDFLFGVAVGMFTNLIISFVAPGPLPHAKPVQTDNHLYLHDGPQHMTILHDVDRDKLRAVAIRVINGRSLTFEAMVGPNKMYTRDKWKGLREELRDRGYWDLPVKGPPIVTEAGKIMFDQLARGGR